MQRHAFPFPHFGARGAKFKSQLRFSLNQGLGWLQRHRLCIESESNHTCSKLNRYDLSTSLGWLTKPLCKYQSLIIYEFKKLKLFPIGDLNLLPPGKITLLPTCPNIDYVNMAYSDDRLIITLQTCLQRHTRHLIQNESVGRWILWPSGSTYIKDWLLVTKP